MGRDLEALVSYVLGCFPYLRSNPRNFTNSLFFGISFFVGVKGDVWGPIFPGYVGKIIDHTIHAIGIFTY